MCGVKVERERWGGVGGGWYKFVSDTVLFFVCLLTHCEIDNVFGFLVVKVNTSSQIQNSSSQK